MPIRCFGIAVDPGGPGNSRPRLDARRRNRYRCTAHRDAPSVCLLVCAVVAGGILENIGRMRLLTAEAHREITRRYSAIMPGLPDWRAMAGTRA